MGLFGGFKAKFSRSKTPKEKPQEVVCLGYHMHSEFDVQRTPVQTRPKNEAIRKEKKRAPLAKSAIFPGNQNPALSPSQKSTSLVNLHGKKTASNHISKNGYAGSSDSVTTSTTIEAPLNYTTEPKVKRNIKERNGVVTENVAIVTNRHRNSGKDKKNEKTVLKTFATNESKTQHSKNSHNDDQSTLIFMTQHSSDYYEKIGGNENFAGNFTKSNAAKKPVANSVHEEQDNNFNINFVPNKTKFDDDEEFKVNVVKHDLNRSQSHSEDERSYQDEEYLQFTGYSSQAASIFFGEDIEPEISRPRRLQLKNDDDEDGRRSSGADC